MNKQQRLVQFQTDQIVGSCQLSGIVVSDEQRDLIRRILSGDLDSDEAIQAVVRRLSAQPTSTQRES